MSWPETVPVLTAKDMCKGAYSGPDGDTHCLMGWVFTSFLASQVSDAADALREVCDERAGTTYVENANDNRLTYDEAAEVWNEAMRRLGYTEVIEV